MSTQMDLSSQAPPSAADQINNPASQPEASVPAAAPTLSAPAVPVRKHTGLSTELKTQVAKIQEIVGECSLVMAGDENSFERGLLLAQGIQQLREALTPSVMTNVVKLCGTPLGFITDRDSLTKKQVDNGVKPYTVDQIRDALIEAMLKGARPIGNEFNIISKRAYLALGYYQRRVSEIPGLTDLEMEPGIPAVQGNSAAVPYVATWKHNGVEYHLDKVKHKLDDGSEKDDRIPVRINEGQGPDAILGKAERKMLAAIYERMTGSKLTSSQGFGANSEVVDAPSTQGADSQVVPDAAEGQDAESGDDGAQVDPHEDLFNTYSLALQLATEEGSIVAAGKAKATALGPECDLPKPVRDKIEMMHADTVAAIRAKRGPNSNKTL